MKTLLLPFLLFCAFECHAQTTLSQADSLSNAKEICLEEVVVLASNMKRMDDHILVLPAAEQRKHATNALEVLRNCHLPGVDVNMSNGTVMAMGSAATLYMNGQECDMRDLAMLRPMDIEKIEYHDAPQGKYSKDRVAVNFVVKQYRYGGYVQAKLSQDIGRKKGASDVAASINHKSDTYSFFAGADYSSLSVNDYALSESFRFSTPLSITRNAEMKKKQHSEYLQTRYQHYGKKHYLVGKLTLLSNRIPSDNTVEHYMTEGQTEDYSSQGNASHLTPKVDINGEWKISDARSLSYGVHFRYDKNKYRRGYTDAEFAGNVSADEDAYSFNAGLIYRRQLKKATMTAELFHYHNVWDSNYGGDTDLWQHLWKGESLAFLTYSLPFCGKYHLNVRAGADRLQYRLHSANNMTQITPRANINLRYRIPNGNLMYSFGYVNSNYGMDLVNNASIDQDRYIQVKGNPDLRKSHDINTYIYYAQQFGKWMLSAVGQYNYGHNYVFSTYSIDGSKLIKSFSNDGNSHDFSGIAGLSCRFSNKLSLSGDMRYRHQWADVPDGLHQNYLTGNLRLSWYWKSFCLAPSVSFGQESMDLSTLAMTKIPFDYNLRMSYARDNLNVSANVASPFNKRRFRQFLSTSAYSMDSDVSDNNLSQYCTLTLAYSLDFGRRTNKQESDIEKGVNTSLLKIK